MPDPIVLEFERRLPAQPERVYALIVDLAGTEPWLRRSAVFRGTSDVSAGPVSIGTTYVERSPIGVRRGRIVLWDSPTRVVFDQPMTLRPALLGTIGIIITVELTAEAQVTRLRRTVKLTFDGPARLLRWVIGRSIRRENLRVLGALERHLARHPVPRPPPNGTHS